MIRALSRIVYFFCFFPFISLINTKTDLQPYALIFSIIYLILLFCTNGCTFPKSFSGILVVFTEATLIFLLSLAFADNFFVLIKAYASYLSIFAITFATYNILKIDGGVDEGLVKVFIIIWLVIGLVQMFINRRFLCFVVPLSRTSVSRGVPGLFSEPSFYGHMCFFAMLLAIDFKKGKIIYVLLLLFQIVFIAQSSVSILYVILFFLFTMISEFSLVDAKIWIKYIFIVLASFSLLQLIFIYLPESRIANVYLNFINNGFIASIFNGNDQSIQDRLDAITNSFYCFYKNYGIPGYFILNNFEVTERFMSGYGTMLYELGVLGIAAITSIFNIIKKSYEKSGIAYALSITIIMFSAVQLAQPLFAFFIGYCIYKQEKLQDSYGNVAIKKCLQN